MGKRHIRRGDIFHADLNPVVGSEQGGVRPVLVIQNDVGNYYSPTVIVAAMSGRTESKAHLPTHCKVEAYAGLEEDSLVLLEQLRTIDKRRLNDYVGRLEQKDMEQVDRCLAVSLNLDLKQV